MTTFTLPTIVTALLLPLLTLNSLAQNRAAKNQKRYLPSGGEKKVEILYKRAGQKELRLDLYYPKKKTSAKLPIVIYTHGGGWAAGSRYKISAGSFSPVYLGLLDKGFAVATVSYRLYKKGGQIAMRDCVIDCKDAVRYLAKNSDELGLDPQRFFVHGDSAGGQIAQILLLSSPESLPGDPALAGTNYKMIAGVSWYGPSDFEKTDLFNHDDRSDFKDRFGARILAASTDPKQKLALYREMSPVQYLKKESPPLLMIQGDKDTTIPVKHAYYMKDKAKAIGAPVETMIIKNSGHNWRKVGTDIEPSREVIVQRTIEFLSDRLDKSK